MELDEFCASIRKEFPAISSIADKLYDQYWNDIVRTEFSSYSWFESLSNAINSEMQKQLPSNEVPKLFKVVACAYTDTQSEVDRAIDVSFVENLFWQVPTEAAEPYWQVFPPVLRTLYIDFHGKSPL